MSHQILSNEYEEGFELLKQDLIFLKKTHESFYSGGKMIIGGIITAPMILGILPGIYTFKTQNTVKGIIKILKLRVG